MSDRPQTHRRIVSYIDKSREYYAAHGYDRPYQWASYIDVPFVKWSETGLDLADATVGIVTTAFPAVFTAPKQVYSQASATVPDEMFTKDLSWDTDATHTNDVGSFLPLNALHTLTASGQVGRVSERFYGVPTEYSQRRTHDDAAQIVDLAKQDEVAVMVLVPL